MTRAEITARAAARREERKRSADHWRHKMSARATANEIEWARCCTFNTYHRTRGKEHWTRCSRCNQPLTFYPTLQEAMTECDKRETNQQPATSMTEAPKESRQTLRPEDLQDVLDSAKNAARKGTQQYLTPPALAAALALPLPRFRSIACDFTCGTGELLRGMDARTCLGVDIDSRAANAASTMPHTGATQSWQVQTGDFTQLYDLLVEADWHCDLLALNPPFSLQWETKRFAALAQSKCEAVRNAYKANAASLDSTLATLMAALDRLTDRGEGYLFCNEATALRLLGEPGACHMDNAAPARALRRHIWLWLSLPEGTFDAAFTPCVLYFARDHEETRGTNGTIFHMVSPTANPSAVLAPLRSQRTTLRNGMELHSDFDFDRETVQKWRACLAELRHRNGSKGAAYEFNLWIDAGKIKRHLTPFQNFSGRIPKKDAEALNALDGQSPYALVMQKPTRLAMLRAVKGSIWRVDPKLIEAVDRAMLSYHAARAPLYKPNRLQSIGWLDEEDDIRCIADLTPKLYVSGENDGRLWHEAGKRLVMKRKNGDVVTSLLDTQFTVPGTAAQADEWSGFIDRSGTYAKKREWNYAETFDSEDEALLWLLNGVQQEKSPSFLTGQTYALQTASRVLERKHKRPNAVTGRMEDCTLHGQELVIRIYDAKNRAHEFGDFSEQERAMAHGTILHPIEDLAAHFHIPEVQDVSELHAETYREKIALLDWLDGRTHTRDIPGVPLEYNTGESVPIEESTAGTDEAAHPSQSAPPAFPMAAKPCDAETVEILRKVQAAMRNNRNADGLPDPLRFRGYQKEDIARASCIRGDDTGRPGILCLSRPTLATLCRNLFAEDGYVGCDEAVRMKSNDSYVSLGVRRLAPEFRLVLTGTPVKNHLDDIFWLLQWSAGAFGCITGWEPGLGKTLPLLLFGLLNNARRHLLVVPESLHDQVCKEAADKFGIEIRRLNSQEDFHKDELLQQCQRDVLQAKRSEVRGFWITSYSQLGYNGADEWIGKENEDGDVLVSKKVQREREDYHTGAIRGGGWEKAHDKGIGVAKWAQISEPSARFPYAGTNADKEKFAREFMLMEQNHTREEDADARGVKRPPRKRVPILCNIHRLWKLLGPLVIRRRKDDVPGCDIVQKTIMPIRIKPGSTQLVVYAHHLANRPQFTKEGKPMAPIAAILAQLTALRIAALCPDSDLLKIRRVKLHKVKSLLSPPKPTPEQAEASAKVTTKAIKVAKLADRTPFEAERETAFDLLTQMMTGDIALDIEALCKAAPSLAERIRAAVEVEVEPPAARSWTDFNPKQAAILAKIADLIAQGEQVVVMSPFQHFSRTLQRRLEQAGVDSLLLDGDLAPAKRGRMAQLFKMRKYPVLIGGIESMGEGHSFENASNLILPSLGWALDKNLQAIDRVHRLNSKKPVTIYVMVCNDTIDDRLEKLFHEKGDAAALALDGRIRPDHTGEVNLAQLLADAVRNFDPNAPSVPEQDIEAEWDSSLKSRLGLAMRRYREWHPPIDLTAPVTPAEIKTALLQLDAPAKGESYGENTTKATSSGLLRNVPDNTLRFLLNYGEAQSTDAARAAFEAWAAGKGGEWKRLWPAWLAQYKPGKPAPIPSIAPPKPKPNPLDELRRRAGM